MNKYLLIGLLLLVGCSGITGFAVVDYETVESPYYIILNKVVGSDLSVVVDTSADSMFVVTTVPNCDLHDAGESYVSFATSPSPGKRLVFDTSETPALTGLDQFCMIIINVDDKDSNRIRVEFN